jgi:hypothetical protein
MPAFITAIRCDSASVPGLVVRHVDERDADLLLQVDEFELHFFAGLASSRERLVEQGTVGG